MVECEWFLGCHNPSTATVEHPALGDVEICDEHQAWLLGDFSPTKMIPPMVARKAQDAGLVHDGGPIGTARYTIR